MTNKTKNNNFSLYYILGGIIILLAVFYLTNSYIKSQYNFEYEGLSFQKIIDDMTGNPLYLYYYFFKDANGELYKYQLFLRTDPRKNNVPIDGEINYPEVYATIYTSINSTDLTQCPTINRDLGTLASFLSDNMFKLVSGVPDKSLAESLNRTYVTCNSHASNMVILIQSGDETKITNSGNCHTITIANCESLQAIEKFEIESVLTAKKRSSSF